MRSCEGVPWWLKRLGLVKAELRGMRFPRTTEEGLRQCAELSAASIGLLREEVRKTLPSGDEESVERETRRLMASFSRIDERWKASWRKESGTPKG